MPDRLFDLSYSEHNLGWLDSKVGRPESALAHYRRAAEMREKVIEMAPNAGRSTCRAGEHSE